MNRFFKAIIATLMFFVTTVAMAQPVVTAPDTVCIYQDVSLSTTQTKAYDYYWGTCSAWLQRTPKGNVIASGNGLNGPTPMALRQDSGKFYLFAVNFNTNYELMRYDFGTNPGSLPTPNNLGNFGGLLPIRCTGLDIYYENGKWYGFAIGGVGIAANLARLEFGNSLANIPTIVNMGNLSGLLISPQDIHFFKENNNYYGYYFNGLSSNLVRLDFGTALDNAPTVNDLGNPGGTLAFPTALKVVEEAGSYTAFVVNRLSNTLTRLQFGTKLTNAPVANNLGNFGNIFNNPRDISIFYDDNKYFGYITNEAANTLVLLKFGNSINNLPTASQSTNFAAFNGPRGISEFVRYYDNVYGFVSNWATSTISQVWYDSSTYATMLKSYSEKPKTYQYTKPGLYNVYYKSTDSFGVVTEEQHQIQVLAKPRLDLTHDTMICQGDTLFMVANGNRLKKILWDPTYNLLYQPDTTSVYVYPDEDYTYNVNMEFDYGCILDTMVHVKVSKIKADAGPDRIVADGAKTELGGPGTSLGYQFKYLWTPLTNLTALEIPNPISIPTDSLIYYYLKVTNLDGCVRYDTVEVKTFCGEINCPNAFNPASNIIVNRTFGIANYQLNKLDYLRVFNRYGQMIFETTNPAVKWDGTFNGQPQPLGTYVWVATGICDNGRKVKRNGNVLLVR
jgi:gliding motility-associated-like protein